MSEGKTVFVNEEIYKKVVELLGYEPSNLVANKFLPEGNKAFIFDNKQFKTPFFKGNKPTFYFNTDNAIRPNYLIGREIQ